MLNNSANAGDGLPRAIEDLSDLAIPGFFESDEELAEFLTWHRAERDAQLV